MELTKEYFDSALKSLMGKMASQESLSRLETKVSLIEHKMVTKDELKVQLEQQTQELKQYTHQAFETQQEYLDERFEELIVKYDVRDRVEKLEKEFRNFKLKKQVQV